MDNPPIPRAVTASHFPRRLVYAILVLFMATLPACEGLMALGRPTDRFVIAPVSGDAKVPSPEGMEATVAIIRKRLEGLGLEVHRLKSGKDGQIIIEVSGKDAEEALAVAIGIKGDLAIRLVDLNALPDLVDQGIAPVGSEVLPMADGSMSLAVTRLGGISGQSVVAAQTGFDQFTNQPMVLISFDEAGSRKLAEISGTNVGKPLAIVLDGKVLSAPVITEPITGGQAQISGGLTHENASQLAVALQSGALPVAFKLVEHTRF